jgi:hypothetical protein
MLFRPAAPANAAAAPATTDTTVAATTAPATAAPSGGTAPANDAEVRAEGARIFTRGFATNMSADDRTYLASLIAQRTGLSQADAEKRVDDTIAAAKQQAETARKAAVAFSFATALSLLVGAFVAAVGGGIGGRHRDEL